MNFGFYFKVFSDYVSNFFPSSSLLPQALTSKWWHTSQEFIFQAVHHFLTIDMLLRSLKA